MNVITLNATKLQYRSGGMSRSSYFVKDKVPFEVYHKCKEWGVGGKDIGPFLKVGDLCLTKKQALRLAEVLAEEAAKMT